MCRGRVCLEASRGFVRLTLQLEKQARLFVVRLATAQVSPVLEGALLLLLFIFIFFNSNDQLIDKLWGSPITILII